MTQRERINEEIYRFFLHLNNEGFDAAELADKITDDVINEMETTGAESGPAILRVLLNRL